MQVGDVAETSLGLNPSYRGNSERKSVWFLWAASGDLGSRARIRMLGVQADREAQCLIL